MSNLLFIFVALSLLLFDQLFTLLIVRISKNNQAVVEKSFVTFKGHLIETKAPNIFPLIY